MYLDFFGLREMPFNITPDPRFIFYTARHREAFDHLHYGIQQRKGFIELVGEVGVGKTTLCRAVLSTLPNDVETALILNPTLDENQLIRAALHDLGIANNSADHLQLIENLNAFLLEKFRQNVIVVLMIDEAQNLSPSVMEQVRLLSNLETDQHKLLQIILSGQPELENVLARNELRQIRQRIMVKCVLQPMSYEETDYYIDHRLLVAGAGDDVFFDDNAIQMVYKRSRGIPRLINKICDRAMLAGYANEKRIIGRREIKHALVELENLT